MKGDRARVDVHAHVLPPGYTEHLRKRGIEDAGGRPLPEWSPDTALAQMDRSDIRVALLSVSTPGVHLGDDAEARSLARDVNDHSAQVVGDHPELFGFLASVPLPDVDGALEETARCLDTLGAQGVVLLANHQGRYLGDALYEPLMAELDRRQAVVFVHPAELNAPPVPGIPAFAADFLLDTTRAAFNLVSNRVTSRYPGISFVLAHAGGFLPYAAHRLAVSLFAEAGIDPFTALDELSGFYFDTALAGPTSLPSLLAFARPGHVLFGSDRPFAPDAAVEYFTGELDAYEAMDPDQRVGIDRANARALFSALPDPA